MMKFLLLSLLAASATAAAARAADANMNGQYIISNPNTQSSNTYSTQLKDYGGGGAVESFTIYSPPVRSQYSQVFWTMMDAVPLPDDIVKRFDGKVMAITGYEADQVIVKAGEPDVSVPITWAYNHHFEHHMNGKNSKLEKVKMGEFDPQMPHNVAGDDVWVSRAKKDDTNPDSKHPTATMFSEGNGGEFRMSYHAYPAPYAQLIESPVSWSMMPMQIDTRNRDGSMSKPGDPFTPGIVPKTSRAPLTGADALYSGLLECPCTDRITRSLGTSASLLPRLQGTCPFAVNTAEDCAKAARTISLPAGVTIASATGNSTTAPAGCSLAFTSPTTVTAFFNSNAKSTAACGTGTGAGAARLVGRSVQRIDPKVQSSLSLDLDQKGGNATITMVGPADKWFAVGFNATQMIDQPYAIVITGGSGKASEYKLGYHAAGTQLAGSVTVVSNSVEAGVRTVVLSRPLKGATPSHFSFGPAFSSTAAALPFISALGAGADFGPASKHYAKGALSIDLLAASKGANTCVCTAPPPAFGDTPDGKISYLGSAGLSFGKRCSPFPQGDLLRQKNPTCDVRYCKLRGQARRPLPNPLSHARSHLPDMATRLTHLPPLPLPTAPVSNNADQGGLRCW